MRILFGPFCGEIGWELCYWQAHGRWLKKQLPTYEFVVVTFEGRQAFYSDFADRVIFHSKTFVRNIGTLDCYKALQLNRELYFKYVDKMTNKHKVYFAVTTPDHNGRFYIGREYQIFKKFKIRNSILKFLPKFEDVKKPAVMIFPRHRDDERDWGEDNWEELCNRLLDCGFSIIIAGIKKQSCLAYYDEPGVINLVSFGAKTHQSLDLTLSLMDKVDITIGSQSFLPLLSLHQKVPSLMWGAEKERHQKELNYFNIPCCFIEDMEYSVSLETIWNNFNKFKEEIKC